MRVDGEVYQLDEVPKLEKNIKHNIDVVIDRVKVKADIKQRLAESFETALRHGNERALAMEMDSAKNIGSPRVSPAPYVHTACPN